MVHLTQVANYSYKASWLKEYELRVLRVGCVSDFTKDMLIDKSMSDVIISRFYSQNSDFYIFAQFNIFQGNIKRIPLSIAYTYP